MGGQLDALRLPVRLADPRDDVAGPLDEDAAHLGEKQLFLGALHDELADLRDRPEEAVEGADTPLRRPLDARLASRESHLVRGLEGTPEGDGHGDQRQQDAGPGEPPAKNVLAKRGERLVLVHLDHEAPGSEPELASRREDPHAAVVDERTEDVVAVGGLPRVEERRTRLVAEREWRIGTEAE